MCFVFCACTPNSTSAIANDDAQVVQTYAMSTLVRQQAWGDSANEAMREVNAALAEWEARLSLFAPQSDIARVNAAAGRNVVQVDAQTTEILRTAVELSAKSEGAFAITIAPITLAWGVTSNAPRVPQNSEIESLLPLIDDSLVEINNSGVYLPVEGMAIDLGGIAKGAVCNAIRDIYNEHGVDSALLNIGGNVYAHGRKPWGERFRVGFSAPVQNAIYSIASLELEDEVMSVSGSYERFFTEGVETYSHIFNPATGRPAQSDIVSVAVICEDGAEADFWSTTLYIWGVQRTLQFMRQGGKAIMLDNTNTMYVSGSVEGFELTSDTGEYIAVTVLNGGGEI